MNDRMAFERALLDALDAGPVAPPPAFVDGALRHARTVEQRRARITALDTHAWPTAVPLANPAVLRLMRIGIVVLLLASLLTAAAAGGWLTRVAPWLHLPFPLVEELGRFSDADVFGFGSALLADGRVLLVGGRDDAGRGRTIASAWIFDPATKRIVPTGSLVSPRADPVVVALADGRALVLGGTSEDSESADEVVPGAEVYAPSSGTFHATASEPTTRRECPCGALNEPWFTIQASLLHDGRVLVTGGSIDGQRRNSLAEIFDPATERWASLDVGCDAGRGIQSVLADGRVLVLCPTEDSTAARLFDPATNTFGDAGLSPAPARWAAALPDGRVLLTGFQPTLFDPANGFTQLSLGVDLAYQRPVVIGPERVLLMGWDDMSAEAPPGMSSTYVFELRTLELRPVQQDGFRAPAEFVRLLDGRILTLWDQLSARLTDPSQLP